MSRTGIVLATSAVALTLAVASTAAAAAPQIPIPPRQHAAWTAPATTIPADFVSATKTLFDLGLADPRGGEYRTVTLDYGKSSKATTTIHAWLLPAGKEKDAPRYAVVWNGLVYPVASVGEPADLAADVDAMVKADTDIAATAAKRPESKTFPLGRLARARPSGEALSETTLLPLKVSLLLRLGQTQLAERAYRQWFEGAPAAVTASDGRGQDPLFRLGTDWTWAKFDRAVDAHQRGDYELAIADSHELAAIGDTLDAAVAARGKEPRPLRGPKGEPGAYFGYLDRLAALLEDDERRLVAGPHPPLDLDNLQTAVPDQQKRIALLIDRLDDTDAQWAGIGYAPVPYALYQEGEAAVGPLLDAMEKDTRLTRTMSGGHSSTYDRSFLGVRDAAYVVLENLSGTGKFGQPYGRASVAQIRAYWKENRGRITPREVPPGSKSMTPEQRKAYLATFADVVIEF